MVYQYKGKEIHPVIELYHDAIPYVVNVSMRDFFLDKEKCAYAWREGLKILQNEIGDICPLRQPTPPPISYGHLICLGCPVQFPQDGEPNVKPIAGSIDEAIDIMKEKKETDFTKNEWFQHYIEIWDYLKPSFPEFNIPFSGFGSQGPITSVVLLRGQDFFMDIYDEPEKSKEFIRLMVDSVIEFNKLMRRINKEPEKQEYGGLCDDFASLISPTLWPEFVIPAINRQIDGLTTPGARRSVHVESLVPQHLPLLRDLNISRFQPSVSDALTIENVKANLDPGIMFDWLLYAYHVTEMTDEEIQEWVDKTVEAGIEIIRTQIGAYGFQVKKVDRVKAFHRAFDKYKSKG